MSITYSGTGSADRLKASNYFPYKEPIYMYGYGGNDELEGAFLHPNYIYGGNGDDIIRGGASGNFLFGDSGNDEINAWQGDYSELYGGDGNDSLVGGDSGNILDGGPGDDVHDSLGGRSGCGGYQEPWRFGGVPDSGVARRNPLIVFLFTSRRKPRVSAGRRFCFGRAENSELRT